MNTIKKKNRYVILAIASLVNFVHGNPYIWTVFQPYVREEFGLSLAASSQPFTIIIGIFAVGNMIGGFLQHKIGAKRTILFGSFVMCAGFFLAALAPHNMAWLVSLGYGALGGLGSGCAFSLLVAVPQAWFPDKRGLVTGITVGVVGLSGVIMNPLCDVVLAAKGYRFAMLMVTVIYAILCLGAFFIEEPSREMELPDAEKSGEEADCQRQYTTKEMMHTRTYYVISVVMALAIPAYVLVNPLMKSLGMERGLTSAQALMGVLIASFSNIIGRFAAPWISDRAGCKRVIQVMYVLAVISVLGLTVARGSLFVLLISFVCMVYGGVVSVFPVLVAEKFGIKYQGMNFGAVMLGYGIVSILCPYLLDVAGQNLSFIIAGAACGIGLLGTGLF
ncbi:MFS transporter [Faecalicatena contorta]|uniref:MFS transporter n=1 Tax=Faecalicatena contorta TaxID=39482 RepID=UPI001F2ED443|nr:MFS transporter [Faecalicatena contorta]MCF2679189.1 MFS transporter [Faecalicatena contorta]